MPTLPIPSLLPGGTSWGAALDTRTVGGSNVLDGLAQRLEAAATGRARPHTLLVGQRGVGKTHMLRVAIHRLRKNAALADKLAVAELPEDVYGGLGRYADLLVETGIAIGERLSRAASVVDLENALLQTIGDRTLVIVVENLDRVFYGIGVGGERNLRSWVETSGRVLLVASAPSLFGGVSDRTRPWYAGLIVTHLDALGDQAGHQLLMTLARQRGDDELSAFLTTDTGRARVAAFAQFTGGGSARIWTFFGRRLRASTLDALVPAAEDVIEALVPYYQPLVQNLAGNQQVVVRQLAEGPTAALTATDIAAATGRTHQTVTSVLGHLERSGWVSSRKLPLDRRQTWYSLRDPMVRHHIQWRSANFRQLSTVAELLRAWYEPSAGEPTVDTAAALTDARGGKVDAAVETALSARGFGGLLLNVLDTAPVPPADEFLAVVWKALHGDEKSAAIVAPELCDIVAGSRRGAPSKELSSGSASL